MAAPAIIQAGSEKMKKEWLPKIAKGEMRFWLGYSEPNAGSDLGSIQTRADQKGDNFILNGQKVWSSGAHIADYAWLVARTGAVEDKHRGLSLLIVDNSSPGITIRPLENICGIHSFNEVFFDQVRVPEENLVGEVNKGFYYLMLALLHERLMIGTGSFFFKCRSGRIDNFKSRNFYTKERAFAFNRLRRKDFYSGFSGAGS
jgi:alkylation response protein AidB-like acyl-CoA dehydrogenase